MAKRNPTDTNNLDTNMFGGEFTPFRDLWNSVAGDLGITTTRMRRNNAMEAALAEHMNSSAAESIQNAMQYASNPVDQQQFKELEAQRQRYADMAQSRDLMVRKAGMEGLATLNVHGDLQDIQDHARVIEAAQNAEQVGIRTKMRDVLVNQAEDLRKKGAALFESQRGKTEAFAQANRLLGDKKFDENNPLNQAQLGELLGLTKREILSNAEDMGDALKAAGGTPVIGPLMAFLGGAMKAEDLKFTKADWQRLFKAAEDVTTKSFHDQLDFYQGTAKDLNTAGQPLGLNVQTTENGFTYGLEEAAQLGEGAGITPHIANNYDEYQSPSGNGTGNTPSDNTKTNAYNQGKEAGDRLGGYARGLMGLPQQYQDAQGNVYEQTDYGQGRKGWRMVSGPGYDDQVQNILRSQTATPSSGAQPNTGFNYAPQQTPDINAPELLRVGDRSIPPEQFFVESRRKRRQMALKSLQSQARLPTNE